MRGQEEASQQNGKATVLLSGFALYNTFYRSFKRHFVCSSLEHREQMEKLIKFHITFSVMSSKKFDLAKSDLDF